MIEKNNDIVALNCFNDGLAVKIKSLFKAYGNDFPFCSFYCQNDEEGKTTAIISRYYSSLTISLSHEAELKELSEFIDFLAPSEVLCDKSLANKLKLEYETVYSVFAFSTASAINPITPSFLQFKEIYAHFSQGDEDISVGLFEDWYADINHRIRHNSCIAYHNDFASAVVFTNGRTGLLNGIAVDKSVRSKGEGSKMLSRVLSTSEINKLYAFCFNGALPFYLKNGFEIESEIALIKRF